jgi:alkaline phosphatase
MSKMRKFLLLVALISISYFIYQSPALAGTQSKAKYVILLIADGTGNNHYKAANLYTGLTPAYQSWRNYWMATYPYGSSYNPSLAWSDHNYINSGYTDSAAAATALYTGVKTANGHISVSYDGSQRLSTLAEEAQGSGMGAGAVTSVLVSDATPGAWLSHNDSRTNGYAIADEALWGDPNTTGTAPPDNHYDGGRGITTPPLDVLIGSGVYLNDYYVNTSIRNKLIIESGDPGAFTYVERQTGVNGGISLLNAAGDPQVTRLAGLFGDSTGNLDYRLADGSGYNSENPTLAQIAEAAIEVLGRNPNGFVLMIEGGAIDHAAHANNMDEMVGEVIDFNNAVQVVIDWVEDTSNDSSWDNTLVIITADHETGYLAASPTAFPNQPLGEITPYTLSLEKSQQDTLRRASWEDDNDDNLIDNGETVYWAWNSGGHTNSLVNLFTKGLGETEFFKYTQGWDPIRGSYLNNTDVYQVMHSVISGFTPITINTIALPLIFR